MADQSGNVTCTFHGSTFVEIGFGSTTVFVDPVFSTVRRGRRVRGDTRPADYVLATGAGESLDDALDVLEDSEGAVLVGSPEDCRAARGELHLGPERTLDLEPWERAKDEAVRITAVPIAIASPFEEGLASIEELAMGAGRAGLGLGRRGLAESDRLGLGLGRLPLVGDLARGRAAGALPELVGALTGALGSLGGARGLGPLAGVGRIGRIGRGRPGLGFLLEPTAGPTVLHLGLGVHAATDEQELGEIGELGEIDAVVIDLSRASVDAVVRAVRALAPSFVLVYRSEDVYERGRRRAAIPVSAFAEAIAEDQGEEVEVQHLRAGDRFVLGPASAASRESAAE